jgi:hypothetical protein
MYFVREVEAIISKNEDFLMNPSAECEKLLLSSEKGTADPNSYHPFSYIGEHLKIAPKKDLST